MISLKLVAFIEGILKYRLVLSQMNKTKTLVVYGNWSGLGGIASVVGDKLIPLNVLQVSPQISQYNFLLKPFHSTLLLNLY